ncbi:MAG: EamA family transporter [Bryobacter sp.]|nr:EamA family transporter [Bryobacter sp.]
MIAPPISDRVAWIALAAVCFFWGTTYLGIRVALEGLAPQQLVAVRFLLSGALILAWALARGWKFPRGREFWWPVGTGLLTLGVGNYCLSLAETYIPSGMAALIITMAPFWMVGMEALVPGGVRPRPLALLSMLVGFAGVLLLLGPDALAQGFSGAALRGFLILQCSCFGWSFGSILQKRRKSGADPILVGGIQQLSVGLAFSVIALLTPAPAPQWTLGVLGAVLYLALFGSILAYSAYLIALARLPVAVVSIYTYVNPVVALALGWLFYRESVGQREVWAMVLIFLGVYCINRFSKKP